MSNRKARLLTENTDVTLSFSLPPYLARQALVFITAFLDFHDDRVYLYNPCYSNLPEALAIFLHVLNMTPENLAAAELWTGRDLEFLSALHSAYVKSQDDTGIQERTEGAKEARRMDSIDTPDA